MLYAGVAIAREIPSTSLRAGSSLRLKNGYAQDDASELKVRTKSEAAPLPLLRLDGLRLAEGYNIRVPEEDPQHEHSHKHQRHAIYATETTGLLVIAFLLLILTVLRYWHDIHWSLR